MKLFQKLIFPTVRTTAQAQERLYLILGMSGKPFCAELMLMNPAAHEKQELTILLTNRKFIDKVFSFARERKRIKLQNESILISI